MTKPIPPGKHVDFMLDQILAFSVKTGQQADAIRLGPLTWLSWLGYILPKARCLSDVKQVRLKTPEASGPVRTVLVVPSGQCPEATVQRVKFREAEP